MFHDRNDARLLVDVVLRRHPVTASHQPQSGILDRLQLPFDDAWPGHRPPDAGGVIIGFGK